jgi:hypothetical protein
MIFPSFLKLVNTIECQLQIDLQKKKKKKDDE